MNNSEKFIEEQQRWKAAKHNHRNKILELRHNANKDFRTKHSGYFKMMDTFAVLILIFNFLAIILTGVLVVRESPEMILQEGNPAQCQWNGWSCHAEAKTLILPILKQMILWAILAAAYIFLRFNIYSYTGLWVMVGIIILYVVATSYDLANDLGLYLGKVLFARVVY